MPLRTEAEIQMDKAPLPQRWLNRLLVSRQQSLEEYELADLLLVLSEKAEEPSCLLGFPKSSFSGCPEG